MKLLSAIVFAGLSLGFNTAAFASISPATHSLFDTTVSACPPIFNCACPPGKTCY